MANSRTANVHMGAYTDYNRGISKHQWLRTSFVAGVWTNFLGILVTIALARLFRIVIRIRDVKAASKLAPGTSAGVAAQGGQSHINKTPNAVEGAGWHMILNAFQDSLSGAIQLQGAGQLTPGRKRQAIWKICVGISLLFFYLVILLLGILTSGLASDSVALSADPACGTYLANATSDDGIANIMRQSEYDVQTDSANWARNCYGDNANPDVCGFFYNQSVKYEVTDGVQCPFSSDLCYGGSTKPVMFSTGAVSGRVLGVNAPHVFEFNRTTVCSPLNMNRTYIQLSSKEGTKYTFHYFYGTSYGLGDHTWESVRHGNAGDIPGYFVRTLYASNPLGLDPVWAPIAALRPPPGSSTTIIFILSQKNYHTSPSHDPIFPATSPIQLESQPPTYYINLSGPGTALACLDRTEWRDPALSPVWSPLTRVPNPLPSDPHTRGAMYFLNTCLTYSTIFSALEHRTPSALIAQSHLEGFHSLPLAREQWKVEAEQLFRTSLARMQIDARNIARGRAAGYPGFVRQNRTRDFCAGTFLFRADGWVNVDVVWSSVVLAVTAVLVLLAIPSGEEELWPESAWGWLRAGRWRSMASGIGRVLVAASKGVVKALGWVGKGINDLALKTYNWSQWPVIGRSIKRTLHSMIWGLRHGGSAWRAFLRMIGL